MHFCCRAPYGARGLKFKNALAEESAAVSRPVWGAWIEIAMGALLKDLGTGRAPYGARGLK